MVARRKTSDTNLLSRTRRYSDERSVELPDTFSFIENGVRNFCDLISVYNLNAKFKTYVRLRVAFSERKFPIFSQKRSRAKLRPRIWFQKSIGLSFPKIFRSRAWK